jgi:hypothetical protein
MRTESHEYLQRLNMMYQAQQIYVPLFNKIKNPDGSVDDEVVEVIQDGTIQPVLNLACIFRRMEPVRSVIIPWQMIDTIIVCAVNIDISFGNYPVEIVSIGKMQTFDNCYPITLRYIN